MKNYILSVIILFCLFACNKQTNKELTYTLSLDTILSSTNESFFRDSITITYYGKDSILIKNYDNRYILENLYLNFNNVFYEKRWVYNPIIDYSGIDTILTFTQKDTTFIYKSKRDDFIVTFVDITFFDSKYTIVKDGNDYKTIKQSLADSTYTEIIFYDKDYHIYKFISTYRDDTCVFVEKID